MKIVALICRILLGLMFVVFGANGLHPFMHMDMHFPDPASAYGAAPLVSHWTTSMAGSGWMKAIAALQLLSGLLILAGGTLPLGLCILCPITINILLFHLCLTGGANIAPGAFAAMLELVLIYCYRASFAGILTVKAAPLPSTVRV